MLKFRGGPADGLVVSEGDNILEEERCVRLDGVVFPSTHVYFLIGNEYRYICPVNHNPREKELYDNWMAEHQTNLYGNWET